MRAVPPTVALAVALALSACAAPAPRAAPALPGVASPRLSFSYRADGGAGYVDQVLTIANTGGAAAEPRFDVVPLDAAGEQVRGIRVESAFGTERGGQVVPAHTEVTDILRFVGNDPDDVADVVDVRVEEVEPGAIAGDVPPANDLPVTRYDVAGDTDNEWTLGRIELTNTYEGWVRVMVVGLEYGAERDGTRRQFTRVTPLAGPIDVAPGRTARETVARGERDRFYGSVRAYLVR